ncbi:dynactin subunit 6 isoform X2 [Monodelphis domestica]|uniref:dynactin subunit 6 isoform X2 n=1 Tax=Monodelphis domestica TaxID=13616 RepID=UPI0024E221EA|nr:dynactin subunit 6 isoform X2 [Monodelphis domestica]
MTEKISKGVKIAPGAVVCVESEIRGDVTIGPRTVIHPKARIIAEAGPIVIGEGNLIEEQALILNGYPENIIPDMENMEPKSMIIGTNNVFEVGCYSEAMKMGDNNVIESKAHVGRNVMLTSGCIIGACCNLNTFEVIPENTVIYGADCLRRVQTERPQVCPRRPRWALGLLRGRVGAHPAARVPFPEPALRQGPRTPQSLASSSRNLAQAWRLLGCH